MRDLFKEFPKNKDHLNVSPRAEFGLWEGDTVTSFAVKATSLPWLNAGRDFGNITRSKQKIRNRPKRDFIDVPALPAGCKIDYA